MPAQKMESVERAVMFSAMGRDRESCRVAPSILCNQESQQVVASDDWWLCVFSQIDGHGAFLSLKTDGQMSRRGDGKGQACLCT